MAIRGFTALAQLAVAEIETVTASRPNQEAEADGTALALLSPTITRRVIEKFARIAHPTPPKEFEELSERERDVFRLMARGLSNAEIGSELYISETTVKTRVTHILQKLNLRDRVQAVVSRTRPDSSSRT